MPDANGINYAKEDQTVVLKNKYTDLYTGEAIEGEIKLRGYETIILKK